MLLYTTEQEQILNAEPIENIEELDIQDADMDIPDDPSSSSSSEDSDDDNWERLLSRCDQSFRLSW